MRALAWEDFEFGNFILITTIHLWNQSIFFENSMLSWPLGCDFVTSLRPGFHQANYDHDNDQFRVKTKRLAWRMTAQPYNRFVFVSWSWRLPCHGNQALWKRHDDCTNTVHELCRISFSTDPSQGCCDLRRNWISYGALIFAEELDNMKRCHICWLSKDSTVVLLDGMFSLARLSVQTVCFTLSTRAYPRPFWSIGSPVQKIWICQIWQRALAPGGLSLIKVTGGGGGGITLKLLPRAVQQLKLLPRVDGKFYFMP